MKRAGVYFFFDEDGVVDSYVPYAIRELRKVLDYLVVVVNGVLKPECRKELASVADDMFVRENKGFDAWAYKDGIDYIGWEELQSFDELVLMNFTMFGPVYPLQELFDRMEEDPCDFWGLYMSYENRKTRTWGKIPLKWGYKPDALATCFLVFRSEVLHSVEFARHWNTLPEIRDYYESGAYSEMQLTQMLRDAGFTMSVVCPDSFRFDYQNPTVDGALEAVIACRIPLFRRKVFYDKNGSLDYATDTPRKLLQYLSEKTNYNVDMIWENILRTTNMYDLKNWLNLNAILPLHSLTEEQVNEKLAVIFHVQSEEYTARRLAYLESFPAGTDFWFTVAEEKKKSLEALLETFSNSRNVKLRTVVNDIPEIGALLTACGDIVLETDYDLVCFMHDRQQNEDEALMLSVERYFTDICFENLAANEGYVRNIVDLFHRNPRMGVAFPPPPRNAQYYRLIGGAWQSDYGCLTKLLQDMELKVPIAAGKPPTAPYGRMFWFRPAALAPLFRREWCLKDFEPMTTGNYGKAANTVTTASVFIAQAEGYFPMVIMNSVYAEQELTIMTDIAHTYVGMTIKYIRARSSLNAATRLFRKHEESMIEARNQPKRKPKRSLKKFVRDICPIGLWEVSRKLRCKIKGEPFIAEPKVPRSTLKKVAHACLPRFLWEYLKQKK